MTNCNFCGIRQGRNQPFANAYVCNKCHDNKSNYCEDSDDIIFLDSNNKHIVIDSDTEIDIVDSEDNNSSPIDTNDFKDALLASSYAQLEFLKYQLEEKDLLIRTLIIKDNDVYGVNCPCAEITDDEPDWDEYFNDLYMKFETMSTSCIVKRDIK